MTIKGYAIKRGLSVMLLLFFSISIKKHRLSRHRYTDQHKHLESNREGIDTTIQTVNICLKTLTQNINISNRAYLEFEKRQHKQYNIIGNIETAQPYSWTTEKEHYRPRLASWKIAI